tara:strand:+ start:25965 stop:27038 length:1074 start_codon:yes stop_codon:yes gene_type:complete
MRFAVENRRGSQTAEMAGELYICSGLDFGTLNTKSHALMPDRIHNRLHDDELPIDIQLVKRLVASQFPQFKDLPLIQLGASGSTNILFRLGDELVVRMPRQPGAGTVILKEQQWLPFIGARLSVSVPEFVVVGEPAFGYPEQWSIVRWLDGDMPRPTSLEVDTPEERNELAADLASVILTLRQVELPESALDEPTLRNYRGRSLQEFDRATRYCIKQCRKIDGLNLDLDLALSVWTDGLSLPGASAAGADSWFHGDLVCENLLLKDGKLSSVLDFGGLSIGDPTIDLHGAWELFDGPAREVFRARLNVDDAEWLRGRAWALGVALGTFSYYWAKMPSRMECRLAMVRSVLEDVIAER